ncbi:hypothetical protein BD289DRAFT_437319 [Coniella lustricola]|uniref:Uncharacterized protein n=1 Tax=Coniella lustricola TaxID=2025994 RepID=A0A2T3A438_9PEZI|nr:hypothetical protein BD289DRAFT_437319 [Coniella lustricola]
MPMMLLSWMRSRSAYEMGNRVATREMSASDPLVSQNVVMAHFCTRRTDGWARMAHCAGVQNSSKHVGSCGMVGLMWSRLRVRYSRVWRIHSSVCDCDTTPRTSATPYRLRSREKGATLAGSSMSAKAMVGMSSVPRDWMWAISSRSATSKRRHEAAMASSLPWMRRRLMVAKREGSGIGSEP